MTEKKMLQNPFAKLDGYNCFGCSPDNPAGLQLRFSEEGEYIVARWQPKSHFQGWKDVLHGGIQATLLDEIASWLVFIKLKTSGVTSRMDVKLSKPIYVNQGELTLKARLKEMQRNIAVIETELYNHEMTLCTTAIMHYFTYPTTIAERKLWYPGRSAFNPEESGNG